MAIVFYVSLPQYGPNSCMIDRMVSLSSAAHETATFSKHSSYSCESVFWFFPTPSIRK